MAVVVVVRLDDVQAAEQPPQSGLVRPLGERPVAVVPEQPELPRRVPGRRRDVQPAVAVEVLGRRAAAHVEDVEPQVGRDVGEARQLADRPEGLGRNQVGRRHAVRIAADRHVRDVEQPARGQVQLDGLLLQVVRRRRGGVVEHAGQGRDRLPGGVLVAVNAVAAERQDAGLRVGMVRAVPRLAEPQIGHPQAVARVVAYPGWPRGHQREGLLDEPDGLGLVAQAQLLLGQRQRQAPAGRPRGRTRQGRQLRPGADGRPLADVAVGLRRAVGNLPEGRQHPAMAVRRRRGVRLREDCGGTGRQHAQRGQQHDRAR